MAKFNRKCKPNHVQAPTARGIDSGRYLSKIDLARIGLAPTGLAALLSITVHNYAGSWGSNQRNTPVFKDVTRKYGSWSRPVPLSLGRAITRRRGCIDLSFDSPLLHFFMVFSSSSCVFYASSTILHRMSSCTGSGVTLFLWKAARPRRHAFRTSSDVLQLR